MRDYDSMYYNMSIAPRSTRVVKWLIIINIVTFAAQVFLPWDLVPWLGLAPGTFVRFRFWQIFTYMFLHHEKYLLHILFNMLMLYWFGRDIEIKLGSSRFLRFYLSAGGVSGIIYIVAEYLVGRGLPVIGASGAIMAVMVLYAIFFPDRRLLFMFLFPMKVRTFVLLMVGMDLFVVFRSAQSSHVAVFAHLGGAAYGFAYYLLAPTFQRWQESFGGGRSIRKRDSEAETRRRLDDILDKVNEKGIQSLSRREKKFLKRASEDISRNRWRR